MKFRIVFTLFAAVLSITTLSAESREIDYEELVYTLVPNMTKPIVLDFWATWCGPCHAYAPTFQLVERTCRDAVFYKVNVDGNKELVQAFEIESIPTTIVIYSRSGDYLRATGVLSRPELQLLINRARQRLDLCDD